MRRLAAVVALAVAVLAGCVRVTSETTLGEDDTFSQHAIVAISPSALTALSQQLPLLDLPAGIDVDGLEDTDLKDTDLEDLAGLDPADLLDPATIRDRLAPLEEAHPGSTEVEPYEDEDGRTGVEITVTDVPLEALEDASQANPLAGPAAVTRDGDTYVVEVTTGAASQLAQSGLRASDLRLVESAVDIGVAFTFPGLVREASAGEVSGRTVTLGLGDLLSSDDIRIVAGADREIDWEPILKWGLVALGAIVLIGGATALVVQDRRRRHRTNLPPPRAAGEGPGTLTTRGGDEAPPAGPASSPETEGPAPEDPERP
ncbi:LppM family (lipo)protein [Demequina pelophila]|uniref:LppM family (lipo)protein n=1 Tax=Demequina pelophila TaxID=1638984 RepID=UPI000785EC32|nr:hypothetical protein [Demequina pelophila]